MPRRGVKRGAPPPTPGKPSAKKRKLSRATKVKRAKAAVNRSIITDKFDKRVDYVHVKKRVNKAPILFKKKVLGVLQTQLPPITKVYTIASAPTASTAATEQVWQIFHLKPWDGQAAAPGAGTLYNEAAQNDLRDISEELDSTNLGAEGDTLSQNYWIKQAWMEAYLENSGSTDTTVEIYELDYVPRAGNPINQYASFNAALSAAITGTTTYGTAYSLNTKGITPFDITELLRTYGIRVLKKMTSDMTAGDRVTYTMKDYRKHYVNATAAGKDLSAKFCIQNMTRSLLVISKPGNDATASIRVAVDKHYRIQPTSHEQEYIGGGVN